MIHGVGGLARDALAVKIVLHAACRQHPAVAVCHDFFFLVAGTSSRPSLGPFCKREIYIYIRVVFHTCWLVVPTNAHVLF